MRRYLAYGGQAAVYAALALLIGTFSDSPAYTRFSPDQALIKLSLSHGGVRRGECRRLTSEEIVALPPNERRPMDCARERVPVLVELELDGEVLYRASVPPSGFGRDGPARIYERFAVPAGRHQLVARLRDSERTSGFDYEWTEEMELAAGQNLAIDFRPETGGFLLR